MPIFVQNKADEDLLKSQEFKKVRILENGYKLQGRIPLPHIWAARL